VIKSVPAVDLHLVIPLPAPMPAAMSPEATKDRPEIVRESTEVTPAKMPPSPMPAPRASLALKDPPAMLSAPTVLRPDGVEPAPMPTPCTGDHRRKSAGDHNAARDGRIPVRAAASADPRAAVTGDIEDAGGDRNCRNN
jgi:hypothetical protein